MCFCHITNYSIDLQANVAVINSYAECKQKFCSLFIFDLSLRVMQLWIGKKVPYASGDHRPAAHLPIMGHWNSKWYTTESVTRGNTMPDVCLPTSTFQRHSEARGPGPFLAPQKKKFFKFVNVTTIIPTRSQIFNLKCTKLNFSLDSASTDPDEGA